MLGLYAGELNTSFAGLVQCGQQQAFYRALQLLEKGGKFYVKFQHSFSAVSTAAVGSAFKT